ncbi:uncharacterized protein C8R40DRAFT_1072413 [Lentinula edodes]|uniref:uncharacterized protein n=1 Tax=Lentinula edodes TaxID=5353 RepID=UPI001E8CC1B9|nr:uncharacterized protein C8R40DRAFT_1072413 [Lentinula edodes]KAH7871669.1 hypothetical protein C8R40DRAFT_1072413 [Lentinula edodes]
MPSPAHFQFEFQCAPQCNRGPFTSIQGTNRHRNSCSIWSAHVKAQARKRGHEELEVRGEDEDPAIARRRNLERQRRRRREDEKKKRKIQTDEVEAGEGAECA